MSGLDAKILDTLLPIVTARIALSTENPPPVAAWRKGFAYSMVTQIDKQGHGILATLNRCA